MHEGFVNFNAGTLARAWSRAVSRRCRRRRGKRHRGGLDHGTLSGGGTHRVSIGARTLLGANAASGSRSRRLRRRGGLYVTGGSKIVLADAATGADGTRPVVKGSELRPGRHPVPPKFAHGAIEAQRRAGQRRDPQRGAARMSTRLAKKLYERELAVLQAKLVDLQPGCRRPSAHRRHLRGARRGGQGIDDQARLGVSQPAVTRIVALPAPRSARRRSGTSSATSPLLPAAGEIVLMDRSWYNRAGVERVMATAPTPSIRGSSARCRSSSACSWRTASRC